MPPSVGSKGSLFLREIVEIEVLALFKKKITGHLLSLSALSIPSYIRYFPQPSVRMTASRGRPVAMSRKYVRFASAPSQPPIR